MVPIKTLNSLYFRIIQTLKYLLKLEQEHGRFFLFIPIFIAFGIAYWFTKANETPLLILVSGCIITAIASLKIRHSYPNISLVISTITYFLIGMTFAASETSRNTTILLSKPIATGLRGIVKWREPMQNGKWRYLIQVAESSHEHSNLFLH
ncbi:hypothetical protein [Candidatus Liberibacter sp.]|uniref:hypothetical protein n=1 Tax=Candidatus Liberibacter sp. TaxID=34022 RepID=UPI0015F3796C|nr:hypothetical protein [Candidatus Liberibacter sp.]MBA5724475.1 hypothetical protein [Candidatus Liberibacter sp.]